MRSELQICIGLRWNNPSMEVIHRETERLLDLVGREQLFSNIPLHWNMPSGPFFETKSHSLEHLVETIKQRIASTSDMVIPMGYRGAVQPLLTAAELEREIGWSMTNPWGSGITDVFAVQSRFMIPVSADVIRKEAYDAYVRHDFSRLGIPFSSMATDMMTRLPSDSLISIFQFTPVRPDSLEKMKNRLKSAYKKNPATTSDCLFLLLDLSGMEETAASPIDYSPLVAIIEMIGHKRNIRFVNFGGQASTLLSLANGHPVLVQPNNPVIRERVNDAKALRSKKTKGDSEYRDILTRLGIPTSGEPGVHHHAKKIKFPSNERATIADMQGNAILTGNGFDAVFTSGRLADLTRGETSILRGGSARSFLRIDGSMRDFTMINSSSIESDRARGLRVLRRFTLPDNENPGSTITDYVFIEEFPLLIVTALLRYPVMHGSGTFDEFAPDEYALFSLLGDESVSLETENAGSRTKRLLPAGEYRSIVNGERFRFSTGGPTIETGFIDRQGACLGTLEFAMRTVADKAGTRTVFSINPLGTYQPVSTSCFSGKTEIVSYYINVLPCDEKDEPVHFPAHVLDEIPH